MKKNNSLIYKGFYGSINFDQEEKIFFGKIEFIKVTNQRTKIDWAEFIKDLVNYEAKDAENLVNSFKDAVDDYLISCKEANKQPDKPFKGSFNVRIGTELHKKVGLYALQHEDTLNNIVKNALSEFINSHN